jgi:hypothetical protein
MAKEKGPIEVPNLYKANKSDEGKKHPKKKHEGRMHSRKGGK